MVIAVRNVPKINGRKGMSEGPFGLGLADEHLNLAFLALFHMVFRWIL